MASERPNHNQAEEPPVTLDEKSQELAALLQRTLHGLDSDLGATLDQPVVTVQPEQLVEVARKLRDDPETLCDMLLCLSVVDYEDRFEIVYHLQSLEKKHRIVVKTNATYENPRVPSVISVWPGADWYEREGHDLFGVAFDGHPNLSPLLLYEEFEGYPGRKSFPFYDYQEW